MKPKPYVQHVAITGGIVHVIRRGQHLGGLLAIVAFNGGVVLASDLVAPHP